MHLVSSANQNSRAHAMRRRASACGLVELAARIAATFALFTLATSTRLWNSDGLWQDIGLPQFWKQYESGPYGIVIRGWRFAKCASEQWTDYKMSIDDLVIWPQYPRFPGPVYFNVTASVNEPLPVDRLELELEVRQLVQSQNGDTRWQIIPCQGWDLLNGCDGVGSCRYCEMWAKCKKLVRSGYKHADSDKVKNFLKSEERLCPPSVGQWTLSFSQTLNVEDIPKGIFGPLQSNQYWLTFTFTDGSGGQVGCARVWIDVCKHHLYDKQQTCLRDPNALQRFLSNLSQQAAAMRQRPDG